MGATTGSARRSQNAPCPTEGLELCLLKLAKLSKPNNKIRQDNGSKTPARTHLDRQGESACLRADLSVGAGQTRTGRPKLGLPAPRLRQAGPEKSHQVALWVQSRRA
jgi:hypothetical protein